MCLFEPVFLQAAQRGIHFIEIVFCYCVNQDIYEIVELLQSLHKCIYLKSLDMTHYISKLVSYFSGSSSVGLYIHIRSLNPRSSCAITSPHQPLFAISLCQSQILNTQEINGMLIFFERCQTINAPLLLKILGLLRAGIQNQIFATGFHFSWPEATNYLQTFSGGTLFSIPSKCKQID